MNAAPVDDLTHYMEAASAYTSLKRELVTIFGVPTLRNGDAWKPDTADGETWNEAMLRRIGGELASHHQQAKYVQALVANVVGPLDLLVKELGGDA